MAKMGVVPFAFSTLSSSQADPAITMGGGAYCCTNWRCTVVLFGQGVRVRGS